MSFTEPFVGSPTVSNTEWSFTNGSTTLASQTTAGEYHFLFDEVANMVAGDRFRLRIYEKVNGGTRRVIWEATPNFVQNQAYYLGPFVLKDGWDASAIRLAGSDRVIPFSIRAITHDVNVISIANGVIAAATFAANAITATVIAASAIGASQLANAAITAAKFATDAIDSAALAASAVTEIQTGLATSSALATVQADTDDIQTRLPAALDGSGFLKAAVQSLVNNAITAASIAASAIGATQIASAAITSAKFATDAIDSGALAASAVTEIQSGIATASALAAVQADTDDIQARLPTALVGGKMSSDVGSWLGTAAAAPTVAGVPKVEVSTIAANAIGATQLASAAITAAKFATDAIDASALAASAVTEIQAGLAVAATALSTATWTNGRAANLDNLNLASSTVNANVSAVGAAVLAVNADTDDIQTRIPAALVGGRISSDVGSWLGTAAAAPTVAGIPKVEVSSLVAGALTAIAGAVPSAAAIATTVMASVVEAGIDVTGTLRGLLAEAAGKLSGVLAGTYRYRNQADTKDRIVGTVTTDGRPSVTLDLT